MKTASRNRKNRNNNIVSYKKEVNKVESNIGLFMFILILFYLSVIILRYATTEHTLTYEVRKGSIMQDNVYTGLIMRHETLVKAPDDGYIQYYYTELSRVGIGHNIFTLSPNDDDFNKNQSSTQGNTDLSEIESNDIKTKIQLFNSTFTEDTFSDVYRLKTDIYAILNSNDNQERINSLNSMANSSSNYNIYKTEKSGILLYEIDGYETMDESEISAQAYDKSKYSKSIVSSGTKVNAGDNIYKLVDDELWTIYIPLNDKDINNLKNLNQLDVRCLKDEQIIKGNFSIQQLNGQNYGKLDFNEGMIRYATDRFLEIELIVDSMEGYKIPLSTVVEKNFYKIPLEYFITGGNDNTTGVYIKESATNQSFYSPSIFYKDQNYAYVYIEEIELNTVLVNPETNESLLVAESEILSGVYNVNRGYAIFKYVEILNASDEYYIVKIGAYQSLLNYDYIALNGLSVEEGDLIY